MRRLINLFFRWFLCIIIILLDLLQISFLVNKTIQTLTATKKLHTSPPITSKPKSEPKTKLSHKKKPTPQAASKSSNHAKIVEN